MNDSARGGRVAVSADGRGLVSQAGAVLLWETMRVTGLGRGLSAALEPWRAPRAVHDPGKIVADLAAALALGGDCLGLAIEQLPWHLRRRVLVRADSGGGTHEFLTWLTAKSRRLHYSVGMTITEAIGKVPAGAWTPAYDGDGQVRKRAWVADITGLLDLDSRPAGMRVIIRKERPHPGAQLRFTDIDGHRFTAFATDTTRGQLADLELRHRRRARCEDPERQGHRAAEPAADYL
jgi:hypothetical protein